MAATRVFISLLRKFLLMRVACGQRRQGGDRRSRSDTRQRQGIRSRFQKLARVVRVGYRNGYMTDGGCSSVG